MTTNTSLLIDLAGVARLADVQRPVVSMWRTRFARTADPFPSAVDEQRGRMLFDASQVADWLTRTERGNNPDARADAAAAATPPEFSFSDRQAVAELEALITLYLQRGSLEGLSPRGLRMVAAETDAADEFVRAELEAQASRGADWLNYAELLIDAAYSPSAALALVARRHAASMSGAGSTGRLTDDAIELVAAATHALVMNATESGDDVTVMLDAHDAELAGALAEALGDDVDVSLPVGSEARRARRRLITGGRWLVDTDTGEGSRSVVVARVPAGRDDDVATMLRAVDDVSLSIRDMDSAIVIGPARALVDALDPGAELIRSDILRTGRVRGIARLAPGLIEAAPRESLALWVLGAPMGQVAIGERFTVVADLIDMPLTDATRTDLVTDLVASMGSKREVRGHTFRFGRFVRTPNLLARGGSVVHSVAVRGRARAKAADLPALIDAAADTVRTDLEPVAVIPASTPARKPQSISNLIRDGHLRVVSGTRVEPELHGAEGLVVVAASDLDEPSTIGNIRVDQLAFATRHPSAGVTRPGDVIFRTSPTAGAWVDVEGSKIVAYPARVLRITDGDPGGLVPELIAADIVGQPAGPGTWKRWMLRRVAPRAIAPLRGALAEITARRDALLDRAARLDRYAELLAAGVVAGAVTLEPEPRVTERPGTTAAPAVSTQ